LNEAERVLHQMRYLFRGRTDMYGAIHGEAIKADLTADVWRQHLEGQGSAGVYPLVKTASGPRVAWGCTDIDGNKDDPDAYSQTLPLARNMHKTLRLLGITSWVEITKSRGFHVWVFTEDYVPAEHMRHALLLAHQAAGVSPVEVNPKSLTGGKAGNGNYVNVPYARVFADVGRRVVLDPETWEPMTVGDFTQCAVDTINTPQQIAAVAGRYKPPPPPPRVDIESYAGGDLDELVAKLGGTNEKPSLQRMIFNEGPLEGRDRSGTLARLCHLLAESGRFTPGEALALMYDADRRWGKHLERGDPERLDELTARVFGQHSVVPVSR
jgi:hypothetical protein